MPNYHLKRANYHRNKQTSHYFFSLLSSVHSHEVFTTELSRVARVARRLLVLHELYVFFTFYLLRWVFGGFTCDFERILWCTVMFAFFFLAANPNFACFFVFLCDQICKPVEEPVDYIIWLLAIQFCSHVYWLRRWRIDFCYLINFN